MAGLTEMDEIVGTHLSMSMFSTKADYEAAYAEHLRKVVTDEMIAAYKAGYWDVMRNFVDYRDPTTEATREGLVRALAKFAR